MAIYKSFWAYAVQLKKQSFALPKEIRVSLNTVWKMVQEIIRSKHGVRQAWRPRGTSSTPLKNSGELQEAVSYRLVEARNEVVFYSSKNRLAVIHEYGCTFRMTDAQRKYLFAVVFKDSEMKPWAIAKNPGYITIPARPIWRVVMNDPEVISTVIAIVWKAVKKVLA